MADDRARTLVSRQQACRAARATHESHWQDVADLFAPELADFTTLRPPGDRRNQRVYDGTGRQASLNLGAGLWAMLTTPYAPWFRLAVSDPDLARRHDVSSWLEHATERMAGAFAADGYRFYAQAMTLFRFLGTLGTGVFYCDEVPGEGRLWFSCRHLREIDVACDARDRVDTVYRTFVLSARQAVQRFGDATPAKIREATEKRPDQTFRFLHAVLPAAELEGSDRPRRHPFASVYVAMDEGETIGVGGFHEMPYQVPRWVEMPGTPWGDGPGMAALADMRQLNAMAATTIKAAQKAVDPPLLAADELTVRGIRTAPSAINWGMLDANGRELVKPMTQSTSIPVALEMEEQRRGAVREAFFWSQMNLVQSDRMTATEVLARQDEQRRLLGPHVGRIQAEFLDPLIDRVFGLMFRAGAFAPPPDALSGAALAVEYSSPLANAQRTAEAQGVLQTVGAAVQMAAVQPDIMDALDLDASLRAVARAFNMPAAGLRAPEDVEARRAARAQQQQMAAMAEAAPGLAGAVKDLAAAGVGGGGTGAAA